MTAQTIAIAERERFDIREFLADQVEKPLLRFLTCGSVDDGKSTLIGRLLYDTKLIFEDQLAALERDSRKYGTSGEALDFALLVDGLEAEREQGITIDVAYRYFSTPRRRFIVADTPGHEQYTRNMATGASTADLAIVLVDARHGVVAQTRRHSFIVSLLGIRHVVLAVNKIDLVDFDRARFEAIASDYREIARALGLAHVTAIPLSARHGDNVIAPSRRTPWYRGPSLLDHLETVDTGPVAAERPFRLPVQYVNRPNADFRGYAGTIASGTVAVGDQLVVAKSGRTTRVRRILCGGQELEVAGEGTAVTLVLADELDISRGDLLGHPQARPETADRLAADLVWFDEEPLRPGRSYLLRTETDQVPATVSGIVHRRDVGSFAALAAEGLAMNETGRVQLALQAPIAFDPYEENRATGAFILIDRVTNQTVAAGMIRQALREASNIHWQALDVDRNARAAIKNQRPAVLWFTGLSGSGKSTIANLLEKKLHAAGRHTYLLDGDNIRHGLNRDLGFSAGDRAENIRRVAEVARLMADAGLIVLVSFISPSAAERAAARRLAGEDLFVEIFVDTPLQECIRRDPKGLYARALAGELKDFTGIDSPYEPPVDPDIRLVTTGRSPQEVVEELEGLLSERDRVRADGRDRDSN
jgi:bifunctional enzyme CysN/CysC